MILLRGRWRGRRGLVARDDHGATAVEYALMVSLIAVVIIGGVSFFATSVKGLFELIPPFLFGS